MKLCLSIVSSHHLKKKTGWNDLQLCTRDSMTFLLLRNTDAKEKRCVHYIETASSNFIYRIPSLVSSIINEMIYTSASNTGTKFVGVLKSGTLFLYDFIETTFQCVAELPFDPFEENQCRIDHLFTSDSGSFVVVISSDHTLYCCIVANARNSKAQAFSSTYLNIQSSVFSITSSFIESSSWDARCCLFVVQPIDNCIIVTRVIIDLTDSRVQFKQRTWSLSLELTDSISGIISKISINGKYLAMAVQCKNHQEGYLCVASVFEEKFTFTKQLIGKKRVQNKGFESVSALEFAADCSFLLVLTKLGGLCVFTLYGEQLILSCTDLTISPVRVLQVFNMPKSSDYSSRQKFLIRSHCNPDLISNFVVTDGFQACIFKFEIVDKSSTLMLALYDSILSEAEEIFESLEESLSSMPGLNNARKRTVSSNSVLEDGDNDRKLTRSHSEGSRGGSFIDLVKAYENYLGNIGSNDTILSPKNASVASLNRIDSVENFQEKDGQTASLLNLASFYVTQMLGYYSLTVDEFENQDELSLMSAVEKLATFIGHAAQSMELLNGRFQNTQDASLYVLARIVSNFLFVYLSLSSGEDFLLHRLFGQVISVLMNTYAKDVCDKFGLSFTFLLTKESILAEADKVLLGALHDKLKLISPLTRNASDLKELYITECNFLRNNKNLTSVQKESMREHIFFSQKTLDSSGIHAKFLHTHSQPDEIAQLMLDFASAYKERCTKVAKEYQHRNKRQPTQLSVVGPRKLDNSTLSMLYFFLSNYDVRSVLQLIDASVSCYFAPEDTLQPMENNPDVLRTDNLEKFPVSFVGLVSNDKDRLKYLPVLFAFHGHQSTSPTDGSSSHAQKLGRNRASALRSVARLLGRYFLAEQKLFVYPSHHAIEIEALLDDHNNHSGVLFRRRKVFLQRSKIADTVSKYRLSNLWTPQLALSLMLVCGLFVEASQFCLRLGNLRLSTAVLCAAYKLSDRSHQVADPTHNLHQLAHKVETIFNKKEFLESLDKETKCAALRNHLSDLFQLGIVCGLDLMPGMLRELSSRVISRVSSFSLFIQDSFMLPYVPLFIKPSEHPFGAVAGDWETETRRDSYRLFLLFQTVLNAANCDLLLIKNYLLHLQKQLHKTNQKLPDSLINRMNSPADVGLLSEPEYQVLTKCLRSFFLLLWMSNARDQFNQAIRSYNELYTRITNELESGVESSQHQSEEVFEPIWASWNSAVTWANLLLPFAKLMGEEISLIDCLISLFMQMPITKENVSKMAHVFYQPKRVEPRPDLDDNSDSFVFDASLLALSHADYDLSSNEMVPFILEKKYRKLMVRLNGHTAFEDGDGFSFFVQQQRARRSQVIKNGFRTADLFLNQSEALPEIGQLEFELSQDYLLFIGACIEMMMSDGLIKGSLVTSPLGRRVPLLLPYAKQVEKQLRVDTTDQGSNEFLDDLMVPNMRHFIQDSVSTRTLNKQVKKQRSAGVDPDESHVSFQVSKMLSFDLSLSERGQSMKQLSKLTEETQLKNFHAIQDHFSLISLKEQISHSITLSGKIHYHALIDKNWSCVNWLCDWVSREHSTLLIDEPKVGSQKLTVTPNLLANAAWNFRASWNGWPEQRPTQMYVVLPVTAQYHIDRLRIETGAESPTPKNAPETHVKDTDEVDANDSLVSVSSPAVSSPREGLGERQSPGRQLRTNETLISDTEHQILQSIEEPTLREIAQQRVVSSRRKEHRRSRTDRSTSPKKPASTSAMGPPPHVLVDPETLREIIRSESANILQNALGVDRRSPRHDSSSHGRNRNATSRSHSEDEVDFGYSRKGHRSKGHGHRSRKHERRDRQSRFPSSGSGYNFYPIPPQTQPQTVGIPLLRMSGTVNQFASFPQSPGPMLESDPHYMNSSHYQHLPSMRTPYNSLLNPNDVGDSEGLTNEQLVNFLPSRDELEQFHEHRRMQLESAQLRGRQQRLAWVNASNENKENLPRGEGEASEGILIPTEDPIKVKLLRADNEEDIEEKIDIEDSKPVSSSVPIPTDSGKGVEKPVKPPDLPSTPRTPRPILKDQQVWTDPSETKVKKTVTVVTPNDVTEDEVQENLSFEVDEPTRHQTELHDAGTSPLPSPKKSRSEMQTQTSVPGEEGSRVLTVEQIKRGETAVGHESNRAAIPPEIFVNLHFPHVQKRDFLSVVDIEENTMADLPEVTSAYSSDGMHPPSYADLHWQIVKELREGPKPPQGQRSPSGQTSEDHGSHHHDHHHQPAVYTAHMATSPFLTPRDPVTPRSEVTADNTYEVEKEPKGDAFTENVFISMENKRALESHPTVKPSQVTPRTRGKTVNDQLSTMTQQIQVMEEASKRLKEEFSSTHYLMNTVEGMMEVLDPKPTVDKDYQESNVPKHPAGFGYGHEQQIVTTAPRSPERAAESSKEGPQQMDSVPSHVKPSIVSDLDLRDILLKESVPSAASTERGNRKNEAKKQDVRKWMNDKRKERITNYVEHRKDLAQKEHKPWRQQATVTAHDIKKNIKKQQDLKADREAEFTEKRLKSARELLGEMITEQPNTARHPPPSVVLSGRKSATTGASTNRSRTHSKLPIPSRHAESKSRSRSHSQEPPAGYTSWYEYYRLQANHKLAARRRVAEEIRQERAQEEAELMSRLDELSQLSEHSHPNYPHGHGQEGTDGIGQAGDGDESHRHQTQQSKPPLKPFTALVKVQQPEKTRTRTNSPAKPVSFREKVKQAQSSSGPLPKSSVSPTRVPSTQNQAPGAVLTSKAKQTKPRVPKTYSERLKELQREKSPYIRTASQSPVRPGLKSKGPARTPLTYTDQLKQLSNRHTSPAATSENAKLGVTYQRSRSPDNKSYQRSSSYRDRPYASPYREATDKEVILGRGREKERGDSVRDDTSEISDISAWSVPTKVKQLLRLDSNSGTGVPSQTPSKNGAGSQLTSESPRLTNIDFSELDEMESQVSSKLDWEAVEQIIDRN